MGSREEGRKKFRPWRRLKIISSYLRFRKGDIYETDSLKAGELVRMGRAEYLEE